MLKLIPTLPTQMPDKAVRLEWAPLGADTGSRMSADLAPRGQGHMLSYKIGIRRTYTGGQPICGTASRTDLRIMIGAAAGKGWGAQLEMEHTAPLKLQGAGDMDAALKAVEQQIVAYAKTLRPLTLGSGTAIPAALHAPSGGELIALA